MKFVSKSTNLHIILRPGIPAQPITGTPAVPTLSVRFIDGIAEVKDEEHIKMMLNHPGYNSDFIAVDEAASDPYAAIRSEIEPAHTLTEMQFGHPVARVTTKAKPQLPPELMKLAGELAQAMLPSMIEAALAARDGEKSTAPAAPAPEPESEPEVEAAEIETVAETVPAPVEAPAAPVQAPAPKKNTRGSASTPSA